ncbi:hypothetical protein GTA08_BOTSDO05026 [Botryosphaeria dothidea]|nr:hypothetical protein GTA08_BOTSDO05026 [Botryosphaeria dothidea]
MSRDELLVLRKTLNELLDKGFIRAHRKTQKSKETGITETCYYQKKPWQSNLDRHDQDNSDKNHLPLRNNGKRHSNKTKY